MQGFRRLTRPGLSLLPRLKRGLLVFSLLGVLSCLGFGNRSIYVSTAQAKAAAVQLAQDAPVAVEGRLEPRSFVELSALQPGRVEAVFVKEGDFVEKGSVLLRMDNYQRYASEVAAAELDHVLARQAVDELNRSAAVALAEATLALRQAEKTQALAADKLASLLRSKDKSRVDQAKANLMLAEKNLADDREDLHKAQRRYDKRRDIIWKFINRRQYRLFLTMMEKGVAYSERRYIEAKKKYEDLLAPLDEIDLALARSDLALANARLSQAEQERVKWLNGPDPDKLEAANTQMRAAQARLVAARSVLHSAEIVSPISGTILELNIQQGESAISGEKLAVVADLSQWVVETQDMGEEAAVQIEPGSQVSLSLDAYPDVTLDGVVEAVSQYYTEDEGDVFYHAKIGLKPAGVPLLWGMTARIIGWQSVDNAVLSVER